MAELCKECFIETWLTSKEKSLYREGKLKIIEDFEHNDFCEGCLNICSVVDHIEYEDVYYE